MAERPDEPGETQASMIARMTQAATIATGTTISPDVTPFLAHSRIRLVRYGPRIVDLHQRKRRPL
jgi:hypothetical protein